MAVRAGSGRAGSGSWLAYYSTSHLSLCPPAERKEEEMRIRTGTLVDPQTEELATGYIGLNNRNRM